MALNTVSSDRLSTNVKNTNFTAAEKQDLTDDIKPLLGSSGGGNKNLIINGAMQVAQRGTSGSTADGYPSLDRFYTFSNGLDENPTMSQQSLTSSDTPFSSGFRKYLRFQNGNQTSGAGASDQTQFRQSIEGQNVAQSGWNYTSSSSFITLSFWMRASVAQTYYGLLKASDGGNYIYPFSMALSANTWTKVTKTIPGNSNLQIDNDTGNGLEFVIYPYLGTSFTDNSVSLNAWAAYSSGTTRTPDHTTTWYTTNDSTIDITGVQLEVSSVATDFEHRSFHDDLYKCYRYFQRYATGDQKPIANGFYYNSTQIKLTCNLLTTMRTTPTLSHLTGTNYYIIYRDGGLDEFNSFTLEPASDANRCGIYAHQNVSGTSGQTGIVRCNGAAPSGGQIDFSAEL